MTKIGALKYDEAIVTGCGDIVANYKTQPRVRSHPFRIRKYQGAVPCL